MKKIKMSAALFCVFVSCIALSLNVLGYESSSSNYEFDFAITSGKNNDLTSSNYETYVALGTTAGESSSTNFNAVTGFVILAPFLNGEACRSNLECRSNICCSNVCAASCSSGGGSSGGSSGGGGGGSSGGGSAAPDEGEPVVRHNHFFSSLNPNSRASALLRNSQLAVINITFRVNQELESVNMGIELETEVDEEVPNTYQYFSVDSDKLNIDTLDGLLIYFKLPIKDVPDTNVVAIAQYTDDKWSNLPTDYLYSDSTYHYFVSLNDDLGLFAITIGSSVLIDKKPRTEITGETVVDSVTGFNQPQREEETPIEETQERSNLIWWVGTFAILLLVVVAILGFVYLHPANRYVSNKMVKTVFFTPADRIEDHINKRELGKAMTLFQALSETYAFMMRAFFHSKNKERITDRFITLKAQLYHALIASALALSSLIQTYLGGNNIRLALSTFQRLIPMYNQLQSLDISKEERDTLQQKILPLESKLSSNLFSIYHTANEKINTAIEDKKFDTAVKLFTELHSLHSFLLINNITLPQHAVRATEYEALQKHLLHSLHVDSVHLASQTYTYIQGGKLARGLTTLTKLHKNLDAMREFFTGHPESERLKRMYYGLKRRLHVHLERVVFELCSQIAIALKKDQFKKSAKLYQIAEPLYASLDQTLVSKKLRTVFIQIQRIIKIEIPKNGKAR